MSINKRLINTGEAIVPFDPIQNFETVTYTGNGGTQKITGYIRKGAAFNGSSSEVDLPNFMPSGNAARSISMWIKTTTTAYSSLFKYGVGATNTYFLFRINSGTHLGVAFFGNDYDVNVSSTGLFDGNWHQVGMTYDGTTIRLYVDGAEQGSGYNASSTNTTSSVGYLGYQANPDGSSPGGYFNGGIDQARFFNRKLSDSEMVTLYNETYDSSTKSTTDIFGDSSGVALYELDEDANDTGTTPYGTGAIDSGQSAVFNGSSSVIQNSSLGVDFRSQTTLTLSGWINTSASSETANNAILSFSDTSDGSTELVLYFRNTDDNKIVILNRNNGTNSIIGKGETVITDGDWHHFAFVANSSGTKLYVDGSEETVTYSTGNASTQITMPTDLNQFSIGTNQDSSGIQWYMDGKLDQVRIYSSALSSSDVEALASETNVPTANLVAHYKLDGNANDETGSYNGTATSITYSDPAEFPLIAYNGTPTNINFLGMAFQPDWVWIKARSSAFSHSIYDSVRGVQKRIISDSTGAENTLVGSVTSFDSNGFSLGNTTAVNGSGTTYVAWCWKAGGAAVSNTDGTITSQVSANPDAGFSIVSYTGNGGDNQTVGHGLDATPSIIITKNRNESGDLNGNWAVCFVPNSTAGYLNTTNAFDTGRFNVLFGSGTNSNTFTVSVGGIYGHTNENGDPIIAYCFADVDGYQKVGSYSGGTAGVQVTTGFKPRWVLLKNTTTSGDSWVIFDTIRSGDTIQDDLLYANLSNAESVNNANVYINVNSTGFTVANTFSISNGSGNTYIYLAIA